MLQPTAAPTSQRIWMQDRRTKRAVSHQVTSAPGGAEPVPSNEFRSIIYGMSGSDGKGGGRVNHSIDYVNNRAPQIAGKNYSGLNLAKMAKPTLRTQPLRKKKRRHGAAESGFGEEWDPSQHDGSVLAKALSIKLPTHTVNRGGNPRGPTSFPNPNQDFTKTLNSRSHGPGMFNPAVFQPPANLFPSPTSSPHPILSSLAHTAKNLDNQKRRAATKKAKRKTDQSDGYGKPKPAGTFMFMPGMPAMSSSMPATPLSPLHGAADKVSSPPHARMPVADLICPTDPMAATLTKNGKILPRSQLDLERKDLEDRITTNAYLLTAQKTSADRALLHYNNLNEHAVDSLPLNYVFRKAIDRYVRTKCESAFVLWLKFLKIHRAHESVETYQALQASTIVRAARCYLAKIILKVQKRKLLAHKVVCAVVIQNAFRKNRAFNVFAKKKGAIAEARRENAAVVVQSAFRALIYGAVPARRKLRIELHRGLKCLAGRGPMHRVPVLPGLFASEHRRLERALEIVTHPGVPYRTMASVKEARGCVKVCWKVIERREEEGRRQKEVWLASKKAKEDARAAKLETELRKHQELARARAGRERALADVDHLDAEAAEAARRLQRRLQKEIEEMQLNELEGAAGERERMFREERFQRQYMEEIEGFRVKDALLELSAMEVEDRLAHDLIANEKERVEKEEAAALEAEYIKHVTVAASDVGKRSEKIRFHRKQKRYFKSAKNRNEYLKKKREREEKNQSSQRTPSLTANVRRRRMPADFSSPPAGPCVIKKLQDCYDQEAEFYVCLAAQPLPSQRAVDSLRFIEKIKEVREQYKEALSDVAAERGELVKCQDELDDAEEFLARLKARTRNERMAAREKVLDKADDVSQQQLLVDDAEADLMKSAREMVRAIIDAAGSVGASECLPPFKFDVEKAAPNTQSSTQMTAAREWLRQLAEWCTSAEARIKVGVGDRYIQCLFEMGIISKKAAQKAAPKVVPKMVPKAAPGVLESLLDAKADRATPGAFMLESLLDDTVNAEAEPRFRDMPASLKYLEEAHEQGLRMLEEASLMDIIVTMNCEAEYLLSGYDASTSKFFLGDQIIAGGLVFESECLLDKGVLTIDQPVNKCLSAVVREVMMRGRGAVEELRHEVLEIEGEGGMASFQENHVKVHCNDSEARRIRGFIKKLLPSAKETKAGVAHAEDLKVDKDKGVLVVGEAVMVLRERVAGIMKEYEERGEGGGGGGEYLQMLIHRADIEAEREKEKEAEQEEAEKKRKAEEKRLYDETHKKKGLSKVGLVWMEKHQNDFELALGRTRLAKLLEKEKEEVKRREKKRMAGGGIYLFPTESPEKTEKGKTRVEVVEEAAGVVEVVEVEETEEEKKEEVKVKGKWRKKADAGPEEEEEGGEAKLFKEELAEARQRGGKLEGGKVFESLLDGETEKGEEEGKEEGGEASAGVEPVPVA